MSVSSDGFSNGILWSIEASTYRIGALHAYDANHVSNELYNSDQNSSGRDHFGTAIRFTVPTVANGKVYVGSQTQLAIFGLLQSDLGKAASAAAASAGPPQGRTIPELGTPHPYQAFQEEH